MTNREQQQRHDSIRANVSHARLRRGKLFADEEQRYIEMLQDMDAMKDSFHLVDAVNGLTVASLSATITKLKPRSPISINISFVIIFKLRSRKPFIPIQGSRYRLRWKII